MATKAKTPRRTKRATTPPAPRVRVHASREWLTLEAEVSADEARAVAEGFQGILDAFVPVTPPTLDHVAGTTCAHAVEPDEWSWESRRMGFRATPAPRAA